MEIGVQASARDLTYAKTLSVVNCSVKIQLI